MDKQWEVVAGEGNGEGGGGPSDMFDGGVGGVVRDGCAVGEEDAWTRFQYGSLTLQ